MPGTSGELVRNAESRSHPRPTEPAINKLFKGILGHISVKEVLLEILGK